MTDMHTQRIFQDTPFSPQMVIIPPGKFQMGSPANDETAQKLEQPQHEVIIDYPFAVGRFAITFDEWDYYLSHSPDAFSPSDEGWGRGKQPAINISKYNAKAYIEWLNSVTNATYRLLTEAEWEYSCRAQTDTFYWWGDEIQTSQANYNHIHGKTVSVDSYKPNPWGLYNMHGNIQEWVEDQYHDNYINAPTDGSAWDTTENSPRHTSGILRGGSWNYRATNIRSASRNRIMPEFAYDYTGFRLAKNL